MPPLADLPAAYLALERENGELQGTILDLKRQLEWLRRHLFGPGKGEKLDRLQLLLKLQGVEAELAREAAREGGKPLIDSRVEVARAIDGLRLCVQALRSEAGAVLDGALVGEPSVATVELTGPGAVACVQGLLTNDVEKPGEGGFVYGAVLTPIARDRGWIRVRLDGWMREADLAAADSTLRKDNMGEAVCGPIQFFVKHLPFGPTDGGPPRVKGPRFFTTARGGAMLTYPGFFFFSPAAHGET